MQNENHRLIEYSDDSQYFGEVDETGAKSGPGEFYYSQTHQFRGSTIKGTWLNDKLNGLCCYYWANGNKWFEGLFENGKKNGQGILYYHNEKIWYNGFWLDDKKHQTGEIFDRNGQCVYRGGWSKDQYNEFGTLYNGSGRVHYKGGWKDNKYHGKGIEYFQHKPPPKPSDEEIMKENKARGSNSKKGRYLSRKLKQNYDSIDENGAKKIEGEWMNGKKNGYVIQWNSKGWVEINGYFHNDCMTISGKVMIKRNNTMVPKYIGEFQDIEKNEKYNKDLEKKEKKYPNCGIVCGYGRYYLSYGKMVALAYRIIDKYFIGFVKNQGP